MENSNKEKIHYKYVFDAWTMYFDESRYLERAGAGCMIINPKDKHNFLSFILEFKCTNNIVEYEDLVQGINKFIDLKIENIKFLGDSKIVVRKIKNTIYCNSLHLKNYQQEVHILSDNFLAFNIIVVPRTKNMVADSLATFSSRLSLMEYLKASRFMIEFLYQQSVLDNVTNWGVFEGDKKILEFLNNGETFKDIAIDDDVFQAIVKE